MKLIDNLKDGQLILKENNITSYKIDCEILMSKTLNISREDVLLNLEKQIKKEEREKYLKLVNRRKKKEPIAYITNTKSFWRDKFITNENVLIPRPDSEHLVEQSLRIIKKNQSKRILDVGVGSGCLSISIGFLSFDLFFSETFLIKSKSSEITFAVDVNAILNFSFKVLSLLLI